MNTAVKFDDTKYNPGKFNRTTRAPAHDSGTVIKYITPRVITPSHPSSFRGSLRGIAWSKVGTNLPTPTTTELGLATLVQSPRYSTIPAIHSINGKRIIDEQRELSRITETLCDSILQCCKLETHNRAQELQIEWLKQHIHKNRSTIERIFRTEMESANKLVKEHSQQKPALEIKLSDIRRTTSAYDEQYQQLLSKRNAFSKELFNFERQIAQNNAEAQFLKRRVHHFDDESQFYLLKNQALEARKVRLRYELDEEIFSQQSLKTELEILEAEKITNEDIHIASLDAVRKSIDVSQMAGGEYSKHYFDQLNQEVQRIRNEYEKKINVYREELHRKFELELYRYQMQQSRPTSTVTREHELQLQQYIHSKKDVTQQIAAVRGCIIEIVHQIETVEKNVISGKHDENSAFNRKRQLVMLNQSIQDRERRLDEVLRRRRGLEEKIENYRERLNRYSTHSTQNYSNQRVTFHETDQMPTYTSSAAESSKYRSSLQESSSYGKNEQRRASSMTRLPPNIIRSTSPVQRSIHSTIYQTGKFWEEGTLTRYPNFNVNQDCEELHRLINDSTIDEIAVIRIFCNRSVDQRLQIRDIYKNRFQQSLGDAFEKIKSENLSKFLRILLLSPVQRDCFELRRILIQSTINENILVEIFFSRSNKHIQAVRDNYQKLFKTTLEQDIIADRESYSKRIFIAVLQSNRPEDYDVNHNEILKDARDLFETESQWRVDGSTLVRLLCTRNNTQLKQIFTAYQQFSHRDIEQTIKTHIEGNIYRTLTAIIRIIRNRPRFFAYGLQDSLKGTATREEDLNRIIATRCEIDMVQIKIEYEKITKRSLYDHIQTDLTGNYKRAVLELLRQRIELNSRGRVFQHSNEQTEIFQNHNSDRSTVQWRKPITSSSSDIYIKRSLGSLRSSSEPKVNESSQYNDKQSTINYFDSEFERNNQVSSSSSAMVNGKSWNTQYNNRRRFVPMSPTMENSSQLNGD